MAISNEKRHGRWRADSTMLERHRLGTIAPMTQLGGTSELMTQVHNA